MFDTLEWKRRFHDLYFLDEVGGDELRVLRALFWRSVRNGHVTDCSGAVGGHGLGGPLG